MKRSGVKMGLDSDPFAPVEESIENREVFKVRGSGAKEVSMSDSKPGNYDKKSFLECGVCRALFRRARGIMKMRCSIFIFPERSRTIDHCRGGLYIIGVVSLIQYALAPLEGGEEKTILIPIMMLSLFVLSAAVMGYIFLGQPVQLYLDGEKKQAVNFFLKTIATFAGITAILFLSVFLSGLF